MTSLSDFSADEVDQLLDAPSAVLKALIVADGNPGVGGFLKASTRAAKTFRAAQQGDNEFVSALALSMKERGAGQDADEEREPTNYADPDSEALAARAIEAAQASATVLRGRVEKSDAEAYAAWVLAVATTAAEATSTKEGGLLGKKVKISAKEQALIDQLTAALDGSGQPPKAE